MKLDANTLSLIALFVPILALAGSAVAYVIKLYVDASERRKDRFFEMLQYVDAKDTIATKIAAVYELRRFPEHKEFIVRFCEGMRSNIQDNGGGTYLRQEMEKTLNYMKEQ